MTTKKAAKNPAAKKVSVKKAAAKPKAPPKKKQPDLPGMEDRAITKLETLADEWFDLDAEAKSKKADSEAVLDEVHAEMERLGKKTYIHNGVVIEVNPGKDKVKIKVNRTSDAPPTDDQVKDEPETADATD